MGDQDETPIDGTTAPGPGSGLRTPPSEIEQNQRDTADALREAEKAPPKDKDRTGD